MPLIKSKAAAPVGETLDRDKVTAAITQGSVDERWAAARAAADLPSGLDILRDALAQESDPRVREAIFTSLARIRTPASAAVVAPCLRSDDPDVRTGALDALRAMPDATAPLLAGLLGDTDADVRVLACELLRNQPADAANEWLAALLASESEVNVCGAAIEVLAETGTPAVLPLLAQCAERFPNDPFLGFAIGMARDRIGSQASSRG